MRTYFPVCTHESMEPARRRGRIEVVWCRHCRRIQWFEHGRPVDPDAGMAAVFGGFDLVGALPAVNAPGEEVLLYKPSLTDRKALALFEPHTWYEATDLLWLCHDGELLMLAPTDPLLRHNLDRWRGA